MDLLQVIFMDSGDGWVRAPGVRWLGDGPLRTEERGAVPPEQHDFIILGGGSAAVPRCSIERGSVQCVLVLEAGRRDWKWMSSSTCPQR